MRRQSDRRDSYRLHLDPGQVTVNACNNGPSFEMRDLSASGGRLIVRAGGGDLPALPPLEIELAGGDRVRAKMDVVRVRSHEPGVFHLGARWGALSSTCLHKLASFIAREFQRRGSDPARLLDQSQALKVKSPVFIRNLLGQRSETDAQVMSIIDRNLRLGAQLRVDAVAFEGGKRVIRAHFVGETPTQLSPSRPYNFVLNGSAAVTIFESHCLDQNGLDVTLTVPEEVRQSGSRDSRRIELSGSGPAPVLIWFVQSRLAGAHITGLVLDVSDRGLSFRVPATEHGLFPGDRVQNLRVDLPGRTISTQAVVRSISDRAEGDGVACGVELVAFASKTDAEAWRRFVFDRMHPNIVDGNGHADTAWNLLEASKYVALWTPPDAQAHVRSQYFDNWQAAPREVGHSLVLKRQDTPLGLIAGSVLYPRSWMLHHLGRDASTDSQTHAPLRQACELFSGILHRLKTETDLEHFLIYFERGKRWNDRLYVDFAQRYFDKNKLLVTPMQVFRRSTQAPWPQETIGETSGDAPVDLLPSTPALLAQLAQHLGTTTTALERAALALSEDQIDLSSFSETCARLGHERRRDIFFASVDGEVKAALIAEGGSEGVNLFGLLNSCRLISLQAEPPSAAVRRALLHQATLHYRATGKRYFLFFDDVDGTDQAPAELGFELVSGGLRWIAHRDVIPAWAAYLEGLLTSAPGPSEAPPQRQIAPAPCFTTPRRQCPAGLIPPS